MKITTFVKMTALSTIIGLSSACKKTVLHQIKPSAQLEYSINSLKKMPGYGYICFGADTVKIGADTTELNEYLKRESGTLVDYLNDLAYSRCPQEKVGTELGFNTISMGDGSMLTTPSSIDTYEKKYINIYTNIGKGIFTDQNNHGIYIPVKFYGATNPKIIIGNP